MHPKVDQFLAKATHWQAEMEALRLILLDSELTETFKWGKPCYAYNNANLVVIQGFKAYCALLFFKGVLLQDPNGILFKTGENTWAGRQIRFNDLKEIHELEPVLKTYIKQAFELEKAGVKVPKAPTELIFPEEFQHLLETDSELETAFKTLTPGRQRAYNIYFSSAKQAKTRLSRIEKTIPLILAGKGLDDE